MNNQLIFIGVYSLGCERVGKGIAMQWFERKLSFLMQQKEVCV